MLLPTKKRKVDVCGRINITINFSYIRRSTRHKPINKVEDSDRSQSKLLKKSVKYTLLEVRINLVILFVACLLETRV